MELISHISAFDQNVPHDALEAFLRVVACMRIQSNFDFLALVNGLFVGSDNDRGVGFGPVGIDDALFDLLIKNVSMHAFIAELLAIEPGEASTAVA